MRCQNEEGQVSEGNLRGEQDSGELNAVSRGCANDGGDVPIDRDLSIGTDRAAGEGTRQDVFDQPESSTDERGGVRRGYSVRLRVNPVTHGGTLVLLIKKAERRKQAIRRSIAVFEENLDSLRIELEQENEDLQQLHRLLANWQANVDRLRQISEGS